MTTFVYYNILTCLFIKLELPGNHLKILPVHLIFVIFPDQPYIEPYNSVSKSQHQKYKPKKVPLQKKQFTVTSNIIMKQSKKHITYYIWFISGGKFLFKILKKTFNITLYLEQPNFPDLKLPNTKLRKSFCQFFFIKYMKYINF